MGRHARIQRALFIETYGASPRLTGIVLATVAGAYLVGNILGGRMRGACARRALAWSNVGAAVSVSLTWLITPNLLFTVTVFGLAAAIVAARTVIGTTYGFVIGGERTLEVGAARAAFTQVGYLVGSLFGGAALAIGGRTAVGVAFGSLFLAAAAPLLLHVERALRTAPSTHPPTNVTALVARKTWIGGFSGCGVAARERAGGRD